MRHSVWPDCAIFESLWWHIFSLILHKNVLTVWATLKNIPFKHKLLWILFRLLMVKFGLLFISTSGHTGDIVRSSRSNQSLFLSKWCHRQVTIFHQGIMFFPHHVPHQTQIGIDFQWQFSASKLRVKDANQHYLGTKWLRLIKFKAFASMVKTHRLGTSRCT